MSGYLKQLYGYRELLYNITIREIKVRYRQTIIGIVWAILQPLLMMVIFTIIFSKFVKFPSNDLPYPIFSYTALLPWTFFATSLTFAIPSLVQNSNLITKTYFPKEILPFASVLVALIDFIIAAIILAIMMFFYQIELSVNLVFVILILPIQILFTLGVVLFASAINVYYRDVRYALPFIIQLWMFVTPIIYSVSLIPEKFRFIYMLNPMAGIIDSYQKTILKGSSPEFSYLGLAAIISIVLFVISYKYFKHVEITFADVI